MKNLALPKIQAMKPYNPPLDGRSGYDGLLLDFNERTRPPEPGVMSALEKFVRDQKQQLYPEYFDLSKMIAKYAGVKADQIMVTNGADQAIDIIFRTFTDNGDKAIIPAPSFAMFGQSARLAGAKIVSPLYVKADLAFPLQEVLGAIDKQTRLIVICNPNNPTGTLVPLEAIEQIARKAKNAVVYIDEAYFEFSKCSAVSLIDKYPNIVITRTFSKAFGLASLRIGYVIARPEYINEMLKVRGPYDVNQAAYYAASAALVSQAGMEEYADGVMNQAKPLVERFFTKNKIVFYPSAANFILFRPDNPKQVLEVLRQNGVLVRPQDKPNIEGTLRLTIGSLKQMKDVVNIYGKVIPAEAGQKYAFLDRDGTLIFEPFDDAQIDSLEKLQILGGATEGLKNLADRGYKFVLVTNQDGLGTASFPSEAFELANQAMLKTFSNAGITFDQVFVCPHFEQDGCNCRKPKTGLLDEFFRTTNIDMENSFLCGDRETDKELAKTMGLKFAPMPTNGNFSKTTKSFLRSTS